VQNPDLWDRIRSCHPDDVEADFPFSARLARDNIWSLPFAKKVVLEYQRFAYLSRISPGIVTPSDEVDQAWHLHLTYTKHYWGPFKDALGGALHHMPTKGGADQATVFKRAYQETRDLYAVEFGEPPKDIWPSEDIRFGKAPHFQRVNTKDIWMIRKPEWPRWLSSTYQNLRSVPRTLSGSIIAAFSLLFGTGLAFAHGSPEGSNVFSLIGNMVGHWVTQHTFEFFFILVVAGLVLYFIFFHKGKGGKSSGDGSCSSCSSDSGGGSGCSGCGGD
jgi:hypothetical protein